MTAGTAAPLTDGAASCLLAAEETAAELGLPTRMRLVSFAYAGVEPEIMGIGPVPATVKALDRAGLSIEDIGLFEINEAFAVQVLAFLDAFGIADDDPRVNQYGGAIAVGHPLASSGVRLMTQLARQFEENPDVRFGLTTMCVGLGQGGHRHLGEPAPRRLRALRGEQQVSTEHSQTPAPSASATPSPVTSPCPAAPARWRSSPSTTASTTPSRRRSARWASPS